VKSAAGPDRAKGDVGRVVNMPPVVKQKEKLVVAEVEIRAKSQGTASQLTENIPERA
jgi:hypothetical protein